MKTVEGDLVNMALKGKFDVIVHGCNCFHTMGAGIARQIAKEFPEAFVADKQTPFGSILKLGTYSSVAVENEVGGKFIIINAYTQFDLASLCDPHPLSYDAVTAVFPQIAHDFPTARIGYPAIGAGLAGGDWERISKIIDTALEGMDHTFVKFNPQA